MLARINIHSPGKSWKRVRWKDFSLLLVPDKSTLKKIYIYHTQNHQRWKIKINFPFLELFEPSSYPLSTMITWYFILPRSLEYFQYPASAKIHKSSRVDRALENVQTLKWRGVAARGSKWSLARPVYEYFKRTPLHAAVTQSYYYFNRCGTMYFVGRLLYDGRTSEGYVIPK